MDKPQPKKEQKSHWKLRLGTCILLIALSLVGMIITDFKPDASLTYWNIMIPVFALLCLWLSYVDYHDERRFIGMTLWHELLHWAATLAAVYMVASFVHAGIVSNITAGLIVLLILSLSTFLAGIYIDSTFMLIGLMLGLFTVTAVMFFTYLILVTIPICVAVIILLLYLHWRSTKKKEEEADDESFED